MKIAIVQTVSFAVDLSHYNNQAIGQAKALVDLGHSVDYFAPFMNCANEYVKYESGDARLVCIPVKKIKLIGPIAYFPDLADRLIKNEYDVIQTGEDSHLMTPLLLKQAKKHTKAVTVMIQGMYRNFTGYKGVLQKLFDWWYGQIIRKNADLVYGKTPLAIEHLQTKGYRDVRLFPIGLDPIEAMDNAEIKDAIVRFAEKYDYILAYVGALEKRRNPDFLVSLLERLRYEGNRVGLVVVGQGYEFNQEYVLHIPSLKNNQVHLVYKAATALLLPTSYEIYGMVVMEALRCGCPVISTPEAGPSFILESEILGFCRPLDLSSWADALAQIIKNNDLEAKRFRSEYVIKKFDWRTLMSSFALDLESQRNDCG